jgi:hypothetical protein
VASAAAQDLLAVPRRGVELDPAVAVAFEVVLDPHEHLGPHRLRTGIAAPQPAGEGGEEEQRKTSDRQQHRQEHEVLRPEIQPEHVELARRQVEQHRLAAVPAQPREHVVHPQQHPHREHAQALEAPVDRARVDFAFADVQRVAVVDDRGGDGLAHGHQSFGSGPLKRLDGRSSSQVKTLEAAVAAQNKKKAMV